MKYTSGEVFEIAILGPHIGGYSSYKSFSECALSLIRQNEKEYPETRVGKLIYHGVKAKLERAKVDTQGLVLINSAGQSIDYHHQTDAFFFLPVSCAVVTIDLFNIGSDICAHFREYWDDESLVVYGESEFQCYLYSYKKNRGADYLKWCERMFAPPIEGPTHERPENHLILTPYHTEFRDNRERFCRLVADFLIKSSKNGLKVP